MPASVLTLYCDNPEQSGSSSGLLTLTQPGASTSTTGWTVGKVAGTAYSRMTYRTERASTTFGSAQEPSGAPLGKAMDCWRISAATTGDFSAGTWYSSLSVIAVSNGGAMDGSAMFRYWRSANADGTSATQITSSILTASLVTNLATTVAQSSAISVNIGAFSVSNEYLFMQCAWRITGAGGNNAADCLVRLGDLFAATGSGLVTSAFSATGGAVALGGGAYYKKRRGLDALTGFEEL